MELNGHLDRPVSIEYSVQGLPIDIINASLLRTCPKDGPVLSQTDLFLLHPKLELHPILTHSLKSFHLTPKVVGVAYSRAGAVHPYRLVTHIFANSSRNESIFYLATNTPCTTVLLPFTPLPSLL